MDLTTVKSRLDNNYYSELASCVADIKQVRVRGSKEICRGESKANQHNIALTSNQQENIYKVVLNVSVLTQVWTNAKLYNPPDHTIHR